jgi:phosphoribosylformylglycinamidine cyclo-ligase
VRTDRYGTSHAVEPAAIFVAMSSRYERRGVSASKEDVHAAIASLDKGLFPNAFCKVLPDIAGGDEAFCNVMHADTAGTKTALAYLYWKETEDLTVWKGIAQDAIVMNIDDMACAGVCDNIVISSNIARNRNRIPGAVIKAVIEGTQEFADRMSTLGVHLRLAGGETADVGDIVRTIDVGITAFARPRRDQVIEANIQPGDVIVGLASFGQSTYESSYNSGIGCNGLTSARHDVLSHTYTNTFPESVDPGLDPAVVYTGSKRLSDEGDHGLNVGSLLLSPTRTYVPVIRQMVSRFGKKIHALIHCTGGGQTKVLRFAHRVHVIKDNLFDPPFIFKLIQQESGADDREMFQVLNMGHRLEVYVPETLANEVVHVADDFGIEARVVGRCESSDSSAVTIHTARETLRYQ